MYIGLMSYIMLNVTCKTSSYTFCFFFFLDDGDEVTLMYAKHEVSLLSCIIKFFWSLTAVVELSNANFKHIITYKRVQQFYSFVEWTSEHFFLLIFCKVKVSVERLRHGGCYCSICDQKRDVASK